MNFSYNLRRITTAAVTLGFVAAINSISPTLFEWTYPECLLDNGVQYPVQGFPFPYIKQNEGSSGNEMMPHFHLLNILFFALLAYPFVNWSLDKVRSGQHQLFRRVSLSIVVAIGCVLLLAFSFVWGVYYYSSFSRIICPFCHQTMFRGHIRYLDLRPVWYNVKSNQCTQSRWWYPDFKPRSYLR